MSKLRLAVFSFFKYPLDFAIFLCWLALLSTAVVAATLCCDPISPSEDDDDDDLYFTF